MRVVWPTQQNQADITIASIPIMLCICKTSVFGILSCHCTRPWVTLGDLAKYWMTRSVARCLCDSWATCFIVVFHCSCLYLVLCLRHSTSINGVPLKSGLGVTRHWYCEFMRDLYTTLISTDARISFVADSVSLSSFNSTASSRKKNNMAALRSFKIISGYQNWYQSKALWFTIPL